MANLEALEDTGGTAPAQAGAADLLLAVSRGRRRSELRRRARKTR